MSKELNYIKWVMVDQIVDLTTATMLIREQLEKDEFDPSHQKFISIFRVCNTSLIISLSKLWELLSYYGKEINKFPEDLRSRCIKLRAEIERRKIYKFRSKYAAHIIDNDTNTPISLVDGEKRYNDIVGSTLGDIMDFCDWVNPKDLASNKESVMAVVIEARDYCAGILGANSPRP